MCNSSRGFMMLGTLGSYTQSKIKSERIYVFRLRYLEINKTQPSEKEKRRKDTFANG